MFLEITSEGLAAGFQRELENRTGLIYKIKSKKGQSKKFLKKTEEEIQNSILLLLITVFLFYEVIGLSQYLLNFCKPRVSRWLSKAFAGRWRYKPLLPRAVPSAEADMGA